MGEKFKNCTLTNIPSNWNISNVTSLSSCFNGCTSLLPYPEYIKRERIKKLKKLKNYG